MWLCAWSYKTVKFVFSYISEPINYNRRTKRGITSDHCYIADAIIKEDNKIKTCERNFPSDVIPVYKKIEHW